MCWLLIWFLIILIKYIPTNNKKHTHLVSKILDIPFPSKELRTLGRIPRSL